MRNVIEIEGHKAVVAFDPEIALFRGEFIGLNGAADFYARSVDELVAEGRTSLRVFLDLCRERNLSPLRTYSGRFNVRLDPETHRDAALAAAAESKSLNEWVADAIAAAAKDVA
jgi:predicted HicB family RNase H-like nuclease